MRNILFDKKLPILLFLIASLLVTNIAQPVAAFNGIYDEQLYSNNDILYYSPADNGCLSSTNLNGTDNTDYSGGTILNSSELGAIGDNLKIYNEAGSANNVPWQLIAAIHLRSTHLKRFGPSDGNGPYEMKGGGYPIGEYTDAQFLDATNKVAAYIKLLSDKKDLTDVKNVKSTLYAFGGVSDLYITQAKNIGFSDSDAALGEGSPYVMNRADLIRDPTANPTIANKTWGELNIKGDALDYPATISYGTFVTYTALTKMKCNTGGLVTGGMNLDAARLFMEKYKSLNQPGPNPDRQYMAHTLTCNTATDNCVAFSLFFLQKYTTLAYASDDGGKLVSAIAANNPGVQTGTTPRPYAIFSIKSGSSLCGNSPCGHTGVILGVDTIRGVVVVGEAAWCRDSFTAAREYPLAKFSDGSYTYIYAGDHLKAGVSVN